MRLDIHVFIHLADEESGTQPNCQLESILMKLSEIKSAIAEAAAKSTEAFGELSTKIADLQTQIDKLIADASDPDVTDEAFLANLGTLKTNTAALADIVPTPVTAPTPEPAPAPVEPAPAA